MRRGLTGRRSGHLDAPRAGEILAGQRVLVRHDVGRRALGNDLAAMNAGAGADIDDMVGKPDRLLVMLHHDHRVAEIAQPLERLQQTGIVALVQPDRRLVEHIENAGEARADLRGQPDALALAARQRARGAGKGQVFEPDIAQEFQPLADFLEHAAGDLVLLRREMAGQGLEPRCRPAARSCRPRCRCRAPPTFTASASGLSRRPLQAAARNVGEIFGQFLARPLALGLAEAALEIGDHAFERLLGLVGAQPVVIDEADRLRRRSRREWRPAPAWEGPSTWCRG